MSFFFPLIFQSDFQSGQYTLLFFFFSFFVGPRVGYPNLSTSSRPYFSCDPAENLARQNYTGKAFKVARYSLLMWGVGSGNCCIFANSVGSGLPILGISGQPRDSRYNTGNSFCILKWYPQNSNSYYQPTAPSSFASEQKTASRGKF